MNWRHFQTFLWLRWRLLVNQARRGGKLNSVLTMIIAVCAVAVAVPLFFVCLFVGSTTFPEMAPTRLLYVWDGVMFGFVFFWGIGLVAELQRSESLALSKFLHLPVSIRGAFLINYISSLWRLSLIVFAPILFGLGLGIALARGGRLLVVLPLTVAFLLMVTALTYQFQGWLASLMSNPRRRRAIVMGSTAAFVLIFQLPNLINMYSPLGPQAIAGRAQAYADQMVELDRAFKAGEIDVAEYQRRHEQLSQQFDQSREEDAKQWQQTAKLLNTFIPIGWLPLGVMAAAEGNLLPALLGAAAMTLIGAGSLWRSYRTTMRLYQASFTAGTGSLLKQPAPAAPIAATNPPAVDETKLAAAARGGMLEARLPGLSEPVSAIALGGLRSLMRSPEAKMMLLTPLILCAVFGATFMRTRTDLPVLARPLIGFGAIAMALLGSLQLLANQFGFDRDGFRVFVLCSAPRRDILLGKNLAFAPVAFLMAAIPLIVSQVACPMRPDHCLAMLPQFISMYLVLSLVMNLLSIYAPLRIAAGSLKPASMKLVPVLLQFAVIFIAFPLTQIPTLLPLGIEAALEWSGWRAGLPIYLALSVAQCAAIAFVYRALLKWQGDLLQARERRILEVVTDRGA